MSTMLPVLIYLALSPCAPFISKEEIKEWGYQVEEKDSGIFDSCRSSKTEYVSYEKISIISSEYVEIDQSSKGRVKFTLVKEVLESEEEAVLRENEIKRTSKSIRESKTCGLNKVLRVKNVLYIIYTKSYFFYSNHSEDLLIKLRLKMNVD